MRVPCEAPWSLYSHELGVVDLTQLLRLSLVRVQEPPRRFSRSSNWLRSIDLPVASLSQPWLASCTPRTSRFWLLIVLTTASRRPDHGSSSGLWPSQLAHFTLK